MSDSTRSRELVTSITFSLRSQKTLAVARVLLFTFSTFLLTDIQRWKVESFHRWSWSYRKLDVLRELCAARYGTECHGCARRKPDFL